MPGVAPEVSPHPLTYIPRSDNAFLLSPLIVDNLDTLGSSKKILAKIFNTPALPRSFRRLWRGIEHNCFKIFKQLFDNWLRLSLTDSAVARTFWTTAIVHYGHPTPSNWIAVEHNVV